MSEPKPENEQSQLDQEKLDQISVRLQGKLIYLVEKSCLNQNFQNKFIKEINEYLPILIKYALTEKRKEYFYIQNAQRLGDLATRILLSTMETDTENKTSQFKNYANMVKTDMLTIYQEIGVQIDFSEFSTD